LPVKPIVITATDLSSLDSDQLLSRVGRSSHVDIRLDEPVRDDAFKFAVLVSALAHDSRRLTVATPPRRSRAYTSVQSSLLGTLLWGMADPEPLDLQTDQLTLTGSRASEASRRFCAHSSQLSSNTREEFRDDLAVGLRGAGIRVSTQQLGEIAALAFEANSNAEEHGAQRLESPEASVLRFIVVTAYDAFGEHVAPSATHYFDAYTRAGHSREKGWLELIVADSGMGMAFPSYYRLAAKSRWDAANIYDENADVERLRLQLVLEDAVSTKGEWGRVLNRQTAVGEGTRWIKFLLGSLRGYASVRTGRSVATWFYPFASFEGRRRAQPDSYMLGNDELPMYGGTAWHILIPLNTQLALPI